MQSSGESGLHLLYEAISADAEPVVMAAIREDNVNMLKFLINAGVSLNIASEQCHAMHYAASVQSNCILDYLLSINDSEDPLEETPLHHVNLANLKDASGDTPVHYASRAGNEIGIHMLIACGADITVTSPSCNEYTAIHWAYVEQQEKLYWTLLSYWFELDCELLFKFQSLPNATRNQYSTILVKLFIENRLSQASLVTTLEHENPLSLVTSYYYFQNCPWVNDNVIKTIKNHPNPFALALAYNLIYNSPFSDCANSLEALARHPAPMALASLLIVQNDKTKIFNLCCTFNIQNGLKKLRNQPRIIDTIYSFVYSGNMASEESIDTEINNEMTLTFDRYPLTRSALPTAFENTARYRLFPLSPEQKQQKPCTEDENHSNNLSLTLYTPPPALCF